MASLSWRIEQVWDVTKINALTCSESFAQMSKDPPQQYKSYVL